jgi:hypothetical protein
MNKAILLIVLAVCTYVASRKVQRSRTLLNLPRDDSYCNGVADAYYWSVIGSCQSFRAFKLAVAKTASDKSTANANFEKCQKDSNQRWYDEQYFCRGDPKGPVRQRESNYCMRIFTDISYYERLICKDAYATDSYTSNKTPAQLQSTLVNCENVAKSKAGSLHSKCMGTSK